MLRLRRAFPLLGILGGLVTGNWAQILAQLLLGFVEVIAGVIDTIAGLFGADLGGADAIRGLRQDIERGLLEGVDEVTAGVTVAPAGGTLTALDAATSTMPAGKSGEGEPFAGRRITR